jgi:EmrB/QacA subfamily drug resistance transporter
VAHPNAVLAVVLVTYLMIILDISIVITGLPQIRQTLGFSPVALSWVQNAYLLCFGGFLLLAARMGDRIGRKRMLLSGIVLFTVSSLVIGAAQTPFELISARAVQGVGAAILAPSVLALIATTFSEGAERTRALAYYSMVAGAGASLGLVMGGLFADQLSWRVGFLVNVPLGVALWIAARRLLVETPLHQGAFDAVGAIASTLGMAALVYGIVRSAEIGWRNAETIAVIALAAVLLLVFRVNEARVAQPILPLRLFASTERAAAYAARMLFIGSAVGFFFFSTQFMQEVLGYTPLQAGLGFLPMTIPTFLAAMSVPRLTRWLGNGLLLCIGLALMTTGMLWLGQAGPDANFWTQVALPMVVIGFGNGAGLGPLTVAGVSGVEERDHGAASGLVNVAHQLGGSLGLGVLIVVYAGANLPGASAVPLLSHRIAAATTGAGLMNFAGFLISLLFLLPADRARRRATIN